MNFIPAIIISLLLGIITSGICYKIKRHANVSVFITTIVMAMSVETLRCSLPEYMEKYKWLIFAAFIAGIMGTSRVYGETQSKEKAPSLAGNNLQNKEGPKQKGEGRK